VANALNRFLTAFENLDWAAFRAAFSDSATVFHPAPEMAERVTGPRGIDSTFRAVFADIRAHATGGPPYQRLVPTDLRIQPLSPGLVLVTFQLRNAQRLARRTVIFRHEDAGWRILHLHASNVATKP
jgi:ketosteroid isomerase-like protein